MPPMSVWQSGLVAVVLPSALVQACKSVLPVALQSGRVPAPTLRLVPEAKQASRSAPVLRLESRPALLSDLRVLRSLLLR